MPERGRWDRMGVVEQFDYVVGLEAEVERLRHRIDNERTRELETALREIIALDDAAKSESDDHEALYKVASIARRALDLPNRTACDTDPNDIQGPDR